MTTTQQDAPLRKIAKELSELEREYKSDGHEFDSGWNHGIWVAIDTIGEHLGEDEYAYKLGEKKRTSQLITLLQAYSFRFYGVTPPDNQITNFLADMEITE